MEHSLKNTDLEKIGSDTGNYGHGLGMFIQQNGLPGDRSQGQNNTGQKKAINTSGPAIGKNTISRSNKIPNEEGLHQISGWEKPFKGSALKSAVKQLNLFHQSMDGEVSISDLGAVNHADEMYKNLVREVRSFVAGAQKSSSWFHKKEEAALLPAMSSLLIHLYSLGNAFDNKQNLTYDYLMEGNHQTARVGDIMTGRGAMSVQGNMVSTGIQSGQIDRTAKQMNKWDGNEKEVDYLQELKARRLPSFGEKNAKEELQRIAEMLEEIELQAGDSIQREDIRTQFFDVTKMIHILLQNPELMNGNGVAKIQKGKSSHEDNDLELTEEFYKATVGMTVGEAMEKLDEIRQAKAETAAQDSIVSGGVLSQVFIDNKKNRVLRTSKERGGIKEQKAKNNFNYDEAMSRLGEITGLGGQAGARTTYYKDLEGNLQYGTNMDKAGGKQARDVKLSFGDEQADSQMKAGRHNIFGHGNKQELQKNAGLIISSFKMQIIDYLSQHQDRHNENYFIDLDAEDPQQAFKGIDNDNVFGLGTSAERAHRTVSYDKHANDEYYRLYKGYKDVVTILKGFEYIPKETAAQIANLDEKKIGEEMKPYLDRAARFALISRVRKLKEYAANEAKVIDIHTEDGMEAFRKGTMSVMAKALMAMGEDFAFLGGVGVNSNARSMPGILTRTLAMQYFGIGAASKKKDSEEYHYVTEFEYMTGGKSVPEYFAKENNKERAMKLWNSFEGVIQAAGMTENEEYKKLKEKFENGKLQMFW